MANTYFSANFDLMFDFRGVTEVPSGTTPNNPEQPRIVLRNRETTRFSVELSDLVRAAAAKGESELESVVSANWFKNGPIE